MRKTMKTKDTYDRLEISKVTNNSQENYDYVVTYSQGKRDNTISVGIKVSNDGDVLDYGMFAPCNFNKIRETVNQTIKTMHKDNYVYEVMLQKNYKQGVYVIVRAPSHELKVTHVYDSNTNQWWVENDNPDFAMVPTDHYIEKYEDLIIDLAKPMYTEKELKNEKELGNGN